MSKGFTYRQNRLIKEFANKNALNEETLAWFLEMTAGKFNRIDEFNKLFGVCVRREMLEEFFRSFKARGWGAK